MTTIQENKISQDPKQEASQKPMEEVLTKTEKMDIKSGFKIYAKDESGVEDSTPKQVGTVDRLDGEHYLKLKSQDSTDGKSHWIPLGWVERADDKSAYLNRTSAEFTKGQLNEFPKTV